MNVRRRRGDRNGRYPATCFSHQRPSVVFKRYGRRDDDPSYLHITANRQPYHHPTLAVADYIPTTYPSSTFISTTMIRRYGRSDPFYLPPPGLLYCRVHPHHMCSPAMYPSPPSQLLPNLTLSIPDLAGPRSLTPPSDLHRPEGVI